MVAEARALIEDACLTLRRSPWPPFAIFSTRSTSRARNQECGGARSRATTESGIARHHSRRYGGREDSTENGASCRITCDSESRATALTDTVGDRACLDVNEHDGDEDEECGFVEEAHGDPG